jgi:MFS family permease
MSERWLPAWGLAAIAFGGASLLVPLYVVALGGDAFDLGLLFATASFVGVPGALVFGNLADRTGRRRVFVLAAMATTVGTMVAIPLFERILPVLVANALLWFGFAAATPVLTLLVVAGEPEFEWTRLIARLNAYQGVGWAVGLAIGTVIVVGATAVADPLTGQRWFFLACAAGAGVGFALALRRLPADPESGTEPSGRRLRRRVRAAGRFNVRGAAFPVTPPKFDPRGLDPRRFVERFTPALALYYGVIVLAFTGFGVFFAPLPAYLSDAGFGAGAVFGLYLVLNAAAAAFYGRSAALADRYELLRVHAGGLLVRAGALPVVAVVGDAAGAGLLGSGAMAALFVVIGLTWAVTAVTAATLVTRLAPTGVRGEALGVYGALVAVGGGAGGLLGGWLAGLGYTVAFAVAGGLVVAGTAVLLLLSRRTTAAPAPQAESESV